MVLSADEHSLLRDLVRKYDVPGPRYTSYPTVPAWGDQVGWPEAQDALRRASSREQDPLALYLHLPFCPQRCLFCGCNTVITKVAWLMDDYVDHLDKELAIIAQNIAPRRTLGQLHLGGGTPTHLSVEQLARVLETVKRLFDTTGDFELAVEIDPMVCSDGHLDLLAEHGMNRVSLGVQDLDPEVQESVRRIQPIEETQRVTDYARRIGIESINFDLIYGLPHQTAPRFLQSLERVLELRPTRLAVYSFAYVPWLKPHQRAIRQETLPDADMKMEIFDSTRRFLEGAGYEHIGMDHFALAEDELVVAQREGRLRRNFMGYTVQDADDLIAGGVSAISSVAGTLFQSQTDLKAYYPRIDEGEMAVARGYRLSADDEIRGTAIHELMCNLRLDLEALSRDFSIDAEDYLAAGIDQLDPLIADGLLEREPGKLTVTPRGKLFLRNIAMCFDAYLGDRKPAGARFSRTV